MYLADKQHNSYPAHLLQFAQHENFVEYFSSQTELPSFLCPTLVVYDKGNNINITRNQKRNPELFNDAIFLWVSAQILFMSVSSFRIHQFPPSLRIITLTDFTLIQSHETTTLKFLIPTKHTAANIAFFSIYILLLQNPKG